MRFYFDIDFDEYFGEEYGVDFKKQVMTAVVNSIADNFYDSEMNDDWRSAAKEQVSDIIKGRSGDICAAVIERVSDKIASKRAILEMTPKASELAAIDKDNLEYFESLIDKAIAKRFK